MFTGCCAYWKCWDGVALTGRARSTKSALPASLPEFMDVLVASVAGTRSPGSPEAVSVVIVFLSCELQGQVFLECFEGCAALIYFFKLATRASKTLRLIRREARARRVAK